MPSSCTDVMHPAGLILFGGVMNLSHVTCIANTSSRWFTTANQTFSLCFLKQDQLPLTDSSHRRESDNKSRYSCPDVAFCQKIKASLPFYLPFHQYRRTQCEGKPHFLLLSEYLCSAMWRVSFVMNSPEVIRNMLLFQEKNKILKKWWWINRKEERKKQKRMKEMKEGWALLAQKQMPELYCWYSLLFGRGRNGLLPIH